jgi:hypothetical protein
MKHWEKKSGTFAPRDKNVTKKKNRADRAPDRDERDESQQQEKGDSQIDCKAMLQLWTPTPLPQGLLVCGETS